MTTPVPSTRFALVKLLEVLALYLFKDFLVLCIITNIAVRVQLNGFYRLLYCLLRFELSSKAHTFRSSDGQR